ncbi:aspartate aminotransferase family protein [Acidianus sp. RZ1]|uniref:aspartate aminotransferase family protein n=1 Tax=Acidianus sp. RZ1 TaxID=1540082 RepID=UPI00149285E6|nr:aspartate aminotransferase family protein [Acidianus sp. RZ1]NON62295.1 aspartate aminotransferase family protein [Acidianus sp. RZ1]
MTPASKALFEDAKNIIPYGVTSNYRYFDPYPLYLSRGKGSKVWDVDNNVYYDFNMAFGALEVGHGNPIIVQDIMDALNDGFTLGFEYSRVVELAKIIRNRFKVDMVRFSSTGTEATMHAIRLARTYTGKKKILKFEGHYHGSHDQLMVNVNPVTPGIRTHSSPGIPEETTSNTIVTDWNSIEDAERVFKTEKDLAGVIMEPIAMNMGIVRTDPSFLKGVRELCNEYGVVLIFDEVKTSGKFFSGASGLFGINPDISIMSKSISGGLPLSVIGGKKEIMSHIGPGKSAHAGTQNGNVIAVRASISTLTKVLTENAFYYMDKISGELERGYRELSEDLGMEISIVRYGPSGSIFFGEEPRNYKEFMKTDIKRWYTFFYSMLKRKVIPMAGPNEEWTVSVMHTEDDVEKHLEAAEEALKDAERGGIDLEFVESI